MHFILFLSLIGFGGAVPVSTPSLDSLSTTTGKPLSPNSLVSGSPFRNFSTQATASSWWYPNLDHSSGSVRDYVPNLNTAGSPDYNYPTYIAVASGDSTGLVNALYSNGPNGGRDNMYLAGEPRTVYVAPGTYTLTSTAYLDTDTILIGDALNPPIIQASSGFSGDFLLVGGQGGLSSDGNGGELHFSVQIKNIILDTTANVGDSGFTALSWRVAQNSALVNVQIKMPQGAHTGLYIGQGSTIQVADVSFSYGATGVHWDGHQQATLKNFKFFATTTAILIDGGSTLNIFAPTFNTVGFSIIYNSGSPWVSVIDASSTNSGTFFTSNTYPNFMLENIQRDTGNSNMVVVNNKVVVGGQRSIGTYVYGNTYGANPVYQTNPSNQPLSRSKVLAPNTAYPVVSPNQYAGATVAQVINLKDFTQNGGVTLKGDGSTNDGPALQTALNTAASQNKIGYLPFGIYRTLQTITIPVGTRLVGNGWSTISGYGSTFNSESSPIPVVQIGNRGDVGTADIQDMRFTVGQALPGAIIVQVNMAGNNPGDVAIHNSLITVGGTRDTEINCNSEPNCKSAFIGLHLSATSSAYINNVWAWVADHQSDGSSGGVASAAKGGVLIEATKGSWLSGLGSEHFWLYQLSYHGASNVFTSLFQSETNYDQGTKAAVTLPSPFTLTASDPNFSWCNNQAACNKGVAQFFTGASNIYNYAAGSWNFDDSAHGGTQEYMNVMQATPSNTHLYGLTDHDAQYIMRLSDGTSFGNGASDSFSGSWGTLVAQYAT